MLLKHGNDFRVEDAFRRILGYVESIGERGVVLVSTYSITPDLEINGLNLLRPITNVVNSKPNVVVVVFLSSIASSRYSHRYRHHVEEFLRVHGIPVCVSSKVHSKFLLVYDSVSRLFYGHLFWGSVNFTATGFRSNFECYDQVPIYRRQLSFIFSGIYHFINYVENLMSRRSTVLSELDSILTNIQSMMNGLTFFQDSIHDHINPLYENILQSINNIDSFIGDIEIILSFIPGFTSELINKAKSQLAEIQHVLRKLYWLNCEIKIVAELKKEKEVLFKESQNVKEMLNELLSQSNELHNILKKYVDNLKESNSMDDFLNKIKIDETEQNFRKKYLDRINEWRVTLSKTSYMYRIYSPVFIPFIDQGYKVIFNEDRRVIDYFRSR